MLYQNSKEYGFLCKYSLEIYHSNWWRFVLSNSQVKNFVFKDSVGLLGQTRRHKCLVSHTVFYSRSFNCSSATVCCPILKISFIYILNKFYLDALAVGCFDDLDCTFQVLLSFAKRYWVAKKSQPASFISELCKHGIHLLKTLLGRNVRKFKTSSALWCHL